MFIGRFWGCAAVALFLASSFSYADCEKSGDYVVVNVPANDPVRGLNVRKSAAPSSMSLGVIPWNGIGIDILSCNESNGWCLVCYGNLKGWSLMAKYLAPRTHRLVQVVGVSPNDGAGLVGRAGPSIRHSAITHFRFYDKGLIKHACEKNSTGTEWCLVSLGRKSGWVASDFLTANVPTADSSGPLAQPPPGIGSRGCKLYPDLC